MTRNIFTSAKAALVAIFIGTAGLTAPAMAGGQISIGITPTDPDQANAMRVGLGIYSLVQGMKQGGGISQNGNGNAAGLVQNGFGNTGVVHQEGNGHTGTVEQNGHNNACGLFQFGENTDGKCVQNGNGQTGITAQFGF